MLHNAQTVNKQGGRKIKVINVDIPVEILSRIFIIIKRILDLTDGGIKCEENGAKDEAPDEGNDGGTDPDEEEKFNLLPGSQNQKNIGKGVPGIDINNNKDKALQTH